METTETRRELRTRRRAEVAEPATHDARDRDHGAGSIATLLEVGAVDLTSDDVVVDLTSDDVVVDLTSGEVVVDLSQRPDEHPEDLPVGRLIALATVVVIVAGFTLHAVGRIGSGHLGGLTAAYAIMVATYVVSRFVMAAAYRAAPDVGHEPSVAIIVPAFNEGAAVARTVAACTSIDYPADLLEVVCVNDGSTDDTWDHMVAAAEACREGSVNCIDLGSNQGKRAAMAAGIRATTADILVFVDSDSHPAPGAVRTLVQPFADPKVGAVAGLTYVRNSRANLLTRMQTVRYYISFQLMKRAESVVGAVACCSGCFSAYRRAAVAPVLEAWEHQRFLGVACTYGDDRALSNRVIRERWSTRYAAGAEAWTDVPDRYGKFFRQQLRWKKSWSRESFLLLLHSWWSRPLAFPFIVMAVLTSLLSPVVLGYNFVVEPLVNGQLPVLYLVGLYLATVAYAALYRALRNDGMWKFAIPTTVFYLGLSVQLFWAILRLRDGSWGTRG